MAIVADLSGNTPYVDTHIAGASVEIDTTGLATEDKQDDIIQALAGTLTVSVAGLDMEPVAASQTDQMLGTTGAAGDILEGIWIIPATLNPGAVSIENGSTNYPIFAGGTDSVSNLVPFYFSFGAASVGGGWEVTTGADVSVIAVGNFT